MLIAYRGSKNSVKAGLDNQTGPDIATCMEDRDSKRPILIRAWYILFWHALIFHRNACPLIDQSLTFHGIV